MDARTAWIEFHESNIASLQRGLAFMKEGKFETFEAGSDGLKTYKTAQQIEIYERMIAELKNLVTKLQAHELENDKSPASRG